MAYASKQIIDSDLGRLLASFAHHLTIYANGTLPLNINFSKKSYTSDHLDEICAFANGWLESDERNERIWRITQRDSWFILYVTPVERLN